ncbi:exodeoxyribonuclease VII large subunit [candidate division KSB1 bacterium]|nr:exodeoxyribonuclease VII large subunit [candidate division KSB1 bacterium]
MTLLAVKSMINHIKESMLDDIDRQNIYSVSEITREIKELLEYNIPTIWVQGELSNFVHHTSGHLYFSLKDQDAQIACVMWKSRAAALPFSPQNGMKLNVYGSVRVYEKRGNYQLDIVKMHPVGIGDLQLMFEALKQKLYGEGLFDEAHKKPLPPYPERIGIVTSPTGAAIRDILHVLNRRWPSAIKILRPARVQGEGAAMDIAAAIHEMNEFGAVDLMIIGRGGGSLEDLWAFNEEVVARAIYASVIPIISAVGHEIDYTISDFVADRRAPTPSAAAEIIAPDVADLQNAISTLRNRCASAATREIVLLREKKQRLQSRYAFRRPMDMTLQYKQRADDLFHLIYKSTQHRLTACQHRVRHNISRIQSAHPKHILNRGYAIVQKSGGELIRSAEQLAPLEEVNVYLAQGSFSGAVGRLTKEKSFFDSETETETS